MGHILTTLVNLREKGPGFIVTQQKLLPHSALCVV